MRPTSIVFFERLFFAAILIEIVNAGVSFDSALAQLRAMPTLARYNIGSGLMISGLAFSFLVQLCFWYWIAFKASNLARWIAVARYGLSLLKITALVGSMQAIGLLAFSLSLVAYILRGAAVACLLLPDNADWFGGRS